MKLILCPCLAKRDTKHTALRMKFMSVMEDLFKLKKKQKKQAHIFNLYFLCFYLNLKKKKT